MARVISFFKSVAAFVRVSLQHIGEAQIRQREREEFGEYFSPYGWP